MTKRLENLPKLLDGWWIIASDLCPCAASVASLGIKGRSRGNNRPLTSWARTCPSASPAQGPVRGRDPWKSSLIDKSLLSLQVKFQAICITVGPEYNYSQGKCNNRVTINYTDVLDNIFCSYLRGYSRRMTNEHPCFISAGFSVTVNEAATWNMCHTANIFSCCVKKVDSLKMTSKSNSKIP